MSAATGTAPTVLTPEALAKLGLPPLLAKKDKTQVPTHVALGGAEYIGLYFSAHWCPPCRMFTPALGEWFFINGERVKLQLVFVSRDRDEASFDGYFGEMAWDLAVPYESDSRNTMAALHKVNGIPALVIADRDGNVITSEGVAGVMDDEAAESFPWKPKTLGELLVECGPVVDAAGGSTPMADVITGNEYLGLYFSAHWCPPCRMFTPELSTWYTKQTGTGGALAGKLDIVFMTADRDAGSYAEYLTEMPWKAVPYEKKATVEPLRARLNVRGFPTLVFVNTKDWSIISSDAVKKVMTAGDDFPWAPKARDSLTDAFETINTVATCVVFTDTTTDAVNELMAVEALDAVAADYFKDGKVNPRMRFAWGGATDERAVVSLRAALGPKHRSDKDADDAVRVTIVDVPHRRKALFKAGALGVPTKEDLAKFVEDYLAGAAPTVGISE